MIKQLMIPAAAFLVTATTASAFFGSDMLEKLDVDLTDNQVAALEEADEIRQEAHERAQEVLEAAGLDEEKMRELHGAMHEVRQAEHKAMQAALEDDDYDAFIAAIADTPMADAIDSEADFEKFQEMHELHQSGDLEAAQEIAAELDFEGGRGMGGGRKGHGGFGSPDRMDDRPSTESE